MSVLVDAWQRLARVDGSTARGPLPFDDLEVVRDALRTDDVQDDALIEIYLRAAVDFMEGPNGAGFAIVSDAWTFKLELFPWEICLPLQPVVSVDSIAYVDVDGVSQTVNSSVYEVDLNQGRIRPQTNQSWPSTKVVYDAVTVTFTAGHAVGVIPADIQVALLLLTAHFWENRQEVAENVNLASLPLGAQTIIEKYRRGRFGV